MVTRRVFASAIDFGPLRAELHLPDSFPSAAQAEAEASAAAPKLPALDRTDVEFVTIDPPGSRDLDQAVCLRRRGSGFQVWYAIADVLSAVPSGGALEAETWKRGQTVYLPDGNVPLHPVVLSEGAASLLPEQERAAVVWTIDLDSNGVTEGVHVERARVRSRAKLAYANVQREVDQDKLPESIALLPEIGRLLVEQGLQRGAINLPMPEQDVVVSKSGWRLELRPPLPVEEWNAQISLLTGMAAAQLMLRGGVGLLRTMPYPTPEALSKLRTAAAGLGIEWPAEVSVGRVLAGLDPKNPRAAAFIDQTAETLRGAGYTAFDGVRPEQTDHGGVAGAYAHVTAPLRRLADRYATEAALAVYEGRPVPDEIRAALPKLPEVMAETGRIASAADRGAIDLAEALLLKDRVGEVFDAAVVDDDQIALDEPPVRARCSGDLKPGERVRARLTDADPVKRLVRFTAV
ncbi:MAG: RNB domain-containing ribonuclease [Hamadaea sp.]|uniref:RNB domain-containing ribonuclease n=1 Tax=Hamadaea sp. TaxID=2024425 RepID=UPI0018181860|nr:RNB domain-containing ribonuclease [Hamadaea sp.]NUT17947.1 RNB domain-containing ribonuclease [Hamadaea sp.]